MLVKQSNIFLKDLDSFPILEVNDASLHSIPVFQINETNYVDLEKLIESGGDIVNSLNSICYINNISPEQTTLLVNEESMYINPQLADIVSECTNCGLKVQLKESNEVREFSEALENYHNEPGYRVGYTHGAQNDDEESIEYTIDQVSDTTRQLFKDIANAKPEDAENVTMARDIAIGVFKRDADKAALNRHLLAGRSNTGYTGNYVGSSGVGMNFNKEKIEKAKEMLEKGAKEEGGLNGQAMKVTGKIMFDVIKKDINSTEDNLRSLYHHIEREEVPRNFLARMIAKLRTLYHKIMLRAKMGLYNKRFFHGMDRDLIKKPDFEGKSPGVIKQYWILAKHGVPALLKNLAGKVLWVIDKLLQKLQNMANKAGDKINSWMGNKSGNQNVHHESFSFKSVKDYFKDKPVTKKDYDKWTKENKESRWNKLNNPLFKVQDKHGETVAGGALKMAALHAAPVIPFGPLPTAIMAANGALAGTVATSLKRSSNKNKYKKYWKEER